MKIKISDCFGLAPGLATEADWWIWAEHGQRNQEIQPAYDLVPANMKRRMSLPSKLVMQTALSLSSKHDFVYGVFVSRHGELQRTFKLLNEILSGEEASPIAFSQSVHNTSSGLFTIVDQKPMPVTSLAACQDSFQQGVFEAWARMKTAVDGKVLLVCFDGQVPDVYASFADELPFCYALGLVLENGTNGTGWVIKASEKENSSEDFSLPQALQFMRAYTLRQTSFMVKGTRNNWVWTCEC